MSENQPLHAETQKERWVKYGANVAIVCIVVIAIAILLTWLTQRLNARVDTTAGALYSLKPQTIQIIRDNQQPVKLVSLYTRVKEQTTREVAGEGPEEIDRVQAVQDLLEEYKRKGKNIEIDVIDPNEQKEKTDQLIAEVAEKYGGEIAQYKSILADYPATYDKLNKLAKAEMDAASAMQTKLEQGSLKDKELSENLQQFVGTIYALTEQIDKSRQDIDRFTRERVPDYKSAVGAIESGMNALSDLVTQLSAGFSKAKDNEKFPAPVRAYMAESVPRLDEMKKLADELKDRIGKLGELKLQELKQGLEQRNTILVMGPDQVRVLAENKVWQEQDDATRLSADQKLRTRFAGEQQITSAIVAVTSKVKPKIAFIRNGGPPLAGPPSFFQREGPFFYMAERLRDANFDVLEKDITGMWAMQGQMRGMPAQPEPSDEQIKDAIWIVLAMPQQQPQGPMPPTSQLGQKLDEHLKAGGSALILTEQRGENLSQPLDEWGIRLRTDVVAVHEPITGAPQTGDIVEDAQRRPYLFILNEYGNHLLTRPLQSLDGILIPMSVVEVEKKQGIRAENIIPVPQQLKVWGETNIEKLEEARYEPSPDQGPGDVAPPLWAGAVAEKEGGGRVVAIGSVSFATFPLVVLADPRSERPSLRFPANGELFMNSVYWLARLEPMISISPSAMDINRIKPISEGALNFWRIGFVLMILPLAVVGAGVLTWIKRRD